MNTLLMQFESPWRPLGVQLVEPDGALVFLELKTQCPFLFHAQLVEPDGALVSLLSRPEEALAQVIGT